jgi:hypothetical protein
MMLNKILIATCAMTAIARTGGAKAQGIHAVKKLDGYQCMSLAKLWDGVGPQPAPVHVYGAPDPNAPAVGFAAASVIVPSPLKVVDGRIPVLWPNGKTVWVNQADVAPWHVVSDPNARCTPVLLSNGRYGFDGKR